MKKSFIKQKARNTVIANEVKQSKGPPATGAKFFVGVWRAKPEMSAEIASSHHVLLAKTFRGFFNSLPGLRSLPRSFLRITLQFVLPALLLGCAARSTMLTPADCQSQIASLAEEQEKELRSFAALARVKLSREGRIDDFRVELFSRADDSLSMYVRGFLGKAVLKAIIIGDSLTIYFPSDKSYFEGNISALQTGELKDTEHIVNLLLELFRGSMELPADSLWQSSCTVKGNRLVLSLIDRIRGVTVSAGLQFDHDHFPNLKPEKLLLATQDGRMQANIRFPTVKFNREISRAKFTLEIPSSVRQMSRQELVDMLFAMR